MCRRLHLAEDVRVTRSVGIIPSPSLENAYCGCCGCDCLVRRRSLVPNESKAGSRGRQAVPRKNVQSKVNVGTHHLKWKARRPWLHTLCCPLLDSRLRRILGKTRRKCRGYSSRRFAYCPPPLWAYPTKSMSGRSRIILACLWPKPVAQ